MPQQAPPVELVLPSELTLQAAFAEGMTMCGGGAYGSYDELAAFKGLAPFYEDGLDAIAQVTREYLDNGARAITSYTFGPQREELQRIVNENPDFNWDSIYEGRANAYRIAAQVADEFARETGEHVLLLAAVRPPADCYRHNLPQNYSDARRQQIARTALEPLVDVGANNFLFETIPSMRDARAMLEAARKLGVNVGNVALSFYVERNRDGTITLPDGSSLADAAALAREYGVASIGLNCVPPTLAHEALPQIAESWDGWITLHPNGSYMPPTEDPEYSPPTDDPNAHEFREAADIDLPRWLNDADEILGADQNHRLRIHGGCCGTTPGAIGALSVHIGGNHNRRSKAAARRQRNGSRL